MKIFETSRIESSIKHSEDVVCSISDDEDASEDQY